jgi:hypothetical protein
MPLLTVSMVVITVLHSAEVVHVPHESQFGFSDGLSSLPSQDPLVLLPVL